MIKARLILVVFSIVISALTDCLAQDTIFMKNNQRIPATIIEVSPTEIRYKKFELSEGPLYIERKSEVTQIKYKNGFIDTFRDVKQISPTVVKDDYRPSIQYPKLILLRNNQYLYGEKVIGENIMYATLLSLNDPKITGLITKAKESKALKYIGFLAIPLGVAGVYCLAQSEDTFLFNNTQAQRNAYQTGSALCFGGALLSMGASIYFGIDRKIKNKLAVRVYQENYASQ